MSEIRIRIDEDIRKDLMLLRVLENKKSMGKMIRELIEHYKKSKEEFENEE